MDGRFDIIDALIDGERVDPAALKRALADEDGRAYLVDAWLLRDVVLDEIATERETMAPPLRAAAPARWSWVMAATVAGVCLVGGYLVGARLPNVFRPSPVATPAPAPAVAVEPVPSPRSFPVPAATRVIRLELDPNWKEGSGGG